MRTRVEARERVSKRKNDPARKGKGGKEFVYIDWERVDKLLEAGCKGTEIAANLGIHPDTLYNATAREKDMMWTDYSTQKKSSGVSLLRVAQFKKALKGDPSMLKWLGINRAGQSDKINHEHSGQINVVVRGSIEQHADDAD